MRLSSEPAADAAYQVSLRGDHAEPDILIVKAGESVQFNSRDGKTHNLTQGKGSGYEQDHDHTPGLEPGEFSADEGYRVLFHEPGTFYFHDHFNPDISVTVVAYIPESDIYFNKTPGESGSFCV